MFSVARFRLSAGTILLTALLTAPLPAATPRDELLRLIPENVGFCLVIQNVRDHAAALEASPFAAQFRKAVAGQWLKQADQIKQLLDMDGTFKEKFGLGWTGLRDDLLGDAVIFAYWPGEEQYLILIRARSEEVMTSFITTLNNYQKKTGELIELKELEHKGSVYYRRVEKEKTGEKTAYHFQRGPVFVYSPSQGLLQQALDRTATADAEPSLTKLLRQLGADKALLAFYLNPRAFDADLQKNAEQAKGDEAVFLKMFLVYWKALEGLCVSLTLDRDATLAVGMLGDSAKLPPAAQQFVGELSKPAEFWKQVPDNALLALGGRIDFAALAKALGEFLTPDTRQHLHKGLHRLFDIEDVVKDVLPFLGPEVGLVLVAAEDAKHLFPEGLFALRVQPGNKATPIDKALLDRLTFFAKIPVSFPPPPFSKKPLKLETMTFGKQEVKYLDSEAFPAGIKPAFALKDGFLVLAGSPELIRRFVAPAGVAADGYAPLVRVSFKAWRGYLAVRRSALAKAFAEKDHFPEENAVERLNNVMAVLEFVDQLDVRLQTGKGQAVLSIIIRPAQPLKK